MNAIRIRRVVTTRHGGVSAPPYASFNLGENVGDRLEAVAANRARLAAGVGLPAPRLVWMEQVHSRTVAAVDGPLAGPVPATDALVTAEPGLAVAVLVADCVPVLLADPEAGVVAAVHAGRKGVQAEVVPAALRAMVSCGASVGGVHARLGPSVGACCYEVPEPMQSEVAALAPGTLATGGRTRAGAPALDLRAGIAEQLAQAGVPHVSQVGGCTVDDTEFFSHRRDQMTGRFAGLVWLEP